MQRKPMVLRVLAVVMAAGLAVTFVACRAQQRREAAERAVAEAEAASAAKKLQEPATRDTFVGTKSGPVFTPPKPRAHMVGSKSAPVTEPSDLSPQFEPPAQQPAAPPSKPAGTKP